MRFVLLTAVLLATATGCATSPCEMICESANACDLKGRPVKLECTTYCADVASFHDRIQKAGGFEDCAAKYQAHLDCWKANTANICKPAAEFTDCNASRTEWTNCTRAYCAKIATDKGYDASCSNGASTLGGF